MRRAVLGAVAVLLLVAMLLMLTGCGGDPKADPSPSPSPSTPATSPVSTTPSAPVMPEAAKANTKAGAIAFVKYYIDLINHLEATGDESRLVGASQPDCKSCTAVVDAANAIYDSGAHMEGGAWIVGRITASKPTNHLWSVRVDGRIAPSKVIGGGSATPKTGTGGEASAEFFVTFDREWKVAQWHTG